MENKCDYPTSISESDDDDLIALAQESSTRQVPTDEELRIRLKPDQYKRYHHILNQWRKFSQKILKQRDKECLSTFPSVKEIQIFLRWYARHARGVLDEHITDVTLLHRLHALTLVIRLHTGYIYGPSDQKALATFIKGDLVNEGKISTKARHKPVAPFAVAEDLVTFLWKADEYEFLHSRIRLQLAFLIVILALVGCRLGEVVESTAYAGSNEGLHYKDFQLGRKSTTAYTGYFLLVRLRCRKGVRNTEKHAPQLLLYEEPKRRFFCPVAYFLALALADQAIEGCDSFTSLEAAPTPPGTDTCWFKIKSSMLDIPILRAVDQKGVIHQDHIWKYNSISNMFVGLGQRAGYEENLTGYCFRRGFGNTIDNTQSLAQGRTPNQALIEEAISMKARRNLLAPMPPGSQLAKHLHQVDLSETLSMSPQKKDRIQRRLRKKIYVKNREEFFQNGALTDVEPWRQKAMERMPSRYLQAYLRYDRRRRELCTSLFTEEDTSLSQVIPILRSTANPASGRLFYPQTGLTEDNRCINCNKDLADNRLVHSHLLTCTQKRLRREQTAQMQHYFEKTLKRCGWNSCNFYFARKSCNTYSKHVTSHLKANALSQCLWNHCGYTSGDEIDLAYHVSTVHEVPNEVTIPTKIHYCYEHGEYFAADGLWSKHCRQHVEELNSYCGIIRRNRLVVVAGHCLFCLGDTAAAPEVRWCQFSEGYQLLKHMEGHLQKDASPQTCPHPLCEDRFDSVDDFWKHAISDHGIPPPAVKRKRSYDEIVDA
ncbi:uncharacterized protein EI97DRAFT_440482 [Westerdykella ornata]|uniref:C2H2-type domain-containing protein n=1 Tax=Westerdykella ornata TaxID=318751 RepID=A0A6A6JS98_WESOR|nr:uncharacterized protein EI97DRAFT_440482 [Westerdykella ornata]KAF2278993.1 hypothetical protein EI97DRAFT_440482 [Westerdykella ornata]